MHGLSSISASWSRSKLKTKKTKPMWDHSHINNDTHRLPHIWPYIFTPLHQPKTPVFAKNCHPKSQCHTVQVSRILEIFHSKTPNRLEFEKKVPKYRLFCYGFCHWKTPYFFALHIHVCLRGMLPQTRSEAGKFCILETESSNLGILSGANLIKVMKIKFHFYRLNRPNCALYGWISLEDRDDTGYYPL